MITIGFYKFVSNGQGWNFTCQHGPNECRGNLYQACFLKLHEKEDLDEKVQVINCIMSNQSPDTATLNVCNLNILWILNENIINIYISPIKDHFRVI